MLQVEINRVWKGQEEEGQQGKGEGMVWVEEGSGKGGDGST